jgi:hypothetical protein
MMFIARKWVQLRSKTKFGDCFNGKGGHPKRVANLWTEFSAQRRDAMIVNGKEPQNPNKFVVAATVEKANTYVFAESVIMNPTL